MKLAEVSRKAGDTDQKLLKRPWPRAGHTCDRETQTAPLRSRPPRASPRPPVLSILGQRRKAGKGNKNDDSERKKQNPSRSRGPALRTARSPEGRINAGTDKRSVRRWTKTPHVRGDLRLPALSGKRTVIRKSALRTDLQIQQHHNQNPRRCFSFRGNRLIPKFTRKRERPRLARDEKVVGCGFTQSDHRNQSEPAQCRSER